MQLGHDKICANYFGDNIIYDSRFFKGYTR